MTKAQLLIYDCRTKRFSRRSLGNSLYLPALALGMEYEELFSTHNPLPSSLRVTIQRHGSGTAFRPDPNRHVVALQLDIMHTYKPNSSPPFFYLFVHTITTLLRFCQGSQDVEVLQEQWRRTHI